MPAPAISEDRVALSALFFGFLQVGLSAFGGGLVWLRRLVVERRRWLGESEFAEMLSFCQLMPGPNIAGLTVCIGTKLRGRWGALAALGLSCPAVDGRAGARRALPALCRDRVLANLLGGVSAAAAGLVIATGIKLFSTRRRRPAELAFAALAFCGIVFGHLPLFVVLAGLAPLSIAAAAFTAGRAR